MYQLIFTIALWLSVFQSEKDSLFIVIDDCGNWEMIDYSNDNRVKKLPKGPHFYLFQEYSNTTVSLIHFPISESGQLDTMNLTLPKILEKNHLFSSNIPFWDWLKLRPEIADMRIFIVLPKDYCSSKRFLWNQRFTLYEIKVSVRLPDD